MSNIQESITSITKERDTRRHLAVIVCMIAVATVLAVFWSLHIKGITMSSGDLTCGMEEHTHTSDCYAWVPVDEDTEDGSELDETDTAAEPEEGTETETASETEDSTESEIATEAASETVTESATESVLAETGTEALTEDGSEALTEEETETAQVGDTKIIDGVEYVYTLICGMEEHTHTDECYASEESEETETEEESANVSSLTAGVSSLGVTRLGSSGPSSGVSAASVEEEGNSGVATVAEEGSEEESEEETEESGTISLLSSSATYNYYYGDPITLADVYSNVSAGETDDYIIYTIINGTYYILTAEGNLVECSGYGKYPSTSTSDSLQISMLASADTFEAMRWNLTLNDASDSATDDNSGIYDYYIQNATYGTAVTGQYLAPSTTETISSGDTATGENLYAGTSSRYEMSGNGTMIFTITSDADTSDGTFWVEIYDNDGIYITTTSAGTSWYYGLTSAPGITVSYDDNSSNTIGASTEYTVTVTRSGTDNEYFDFVYSYYDSSRDENVVFARYTTEADDNINSDINLHVIAVSGTYTVETAYSTEAPTVTNSTAYENTASGTITDSAVMGTDVGNVTTDKSLTSTSEDFDITYTFTSTTTSNSNNSPWDTFVIELNNGKSGNSYAALDLPAYLTGWWEYYYDSSKSEFVWAQGDMTASVNVTTDVYSVVSSASNNSSWVSALQSGISCTVNVVKTSDDTDGTATLVFTVTIEDSSNTAILAYTVTFTGSSFYGGTTSVYLTGKNCILRNISYVINDTRYTTVTTKLPDSADMTTLYSRYSTTAINTVITGISGSSSDSGWTAYVTLDSGGTYYYLYGEENTAGVSSSEWGTASTKLVTGNTGNTATVVTTFYLAQIREYTVEFDVTDGGDGLYTRSGDGDNSYYSMFYSDASTKISKTTTTLKLTTSADANGNCYVSLPYATPAGSRYVWELQGWYDINCVNSSFEESNYYCFHDSSVDSNSWGIDTWDFTNTVCICGDTVFYADWVADTYNVANIDSTNTHLLVDEASAAQSTADALGYGAGAVDTSSFITSYVFDYNDLLNLYSSNSSADLSNGLTADALMSNWYVANWETTTTTNYLGLSSLGVMFLNSNTGSLGYPNRGASGTLNLSYNQSKDTRTANILYTVEQQTGLSLLSYLFDVDNDVSTNASVDTSAFDTSDNSGILGKTYVGTGNYLFQYNEETGYYYYDAARNAASYRQDTERFYLYDYTVKWSDTKNRSYSDFFPFNYAAYSSSGTSISSTAINYWFRMRTEVEFNLTEDVGEITNLADLISSGSSYTEDDYEYGNQATAGTGTSNMKFVFLGDDDVWVQVDGYTVLDLGGIHGQIYGEIDFSSGLVTIVEEVDTEYYYVPEYDVASATWSDTTELTTSTSWSVDSSGVAVTVSGNEVAYTNSSLTRAGQGNEDNMFLKIGDDGMYEITDEAYNTSGIVTTYTLVKDNADAAKGISYITEGVSGLTDEQVTSIASSGSHKLSMYYLERGASQSNLAVYLNLTTTTYDLTLNKQDADAYANSETLWLPGAQFTVYGSLEGARNQTESDLLYLATTDTGTETACTFTVKCYCSDSNGCGCSSCDCSSTNGSTTCQCSCTSCKAYLECYNLVIDKEYYFRETTAPDGYPISNRIICVKMDSSGTLTVTVYTLTGTSDEAIQSFAYKYVTDSSGTLTILTSVLSDSWESVLDDETYITVTKDTNTSSHNQSYTVELYVQNRKEYEIPSAGSVGIIRYLLIGETLVVVAIIGLIFVAFYQFVWIRRFSTMKHNEEYTGEKSKRSKHFARMRGHPRERSITHGHARDRPGDR